MSRREVLFPVPAGAPQVPCRSCRALVVWITTAPSAKKPSRYMPIAVSTFRRNVLGELEGASHFADCPNAAAHRKARTKREGSAPS